MTGERHFPRTKEGYARAQMYAKKTGRRVRTRDYGGKGRKKAVTARGRRMMRMLRTKGY